MARKPRNLTEEDKDLWDKVRKTAEPLQDRPDPHMSQHAATTRKTPQVVKPKPKHEPKHEHGAFRLGERAKPDTPGHDLAPTIGQKVAAQPVHMDKRRFGDMKRGKLKPEARIDLHGLTLDRAHPTLTDFILTQHARGARLVLVITGKGKSKPEPGPIPTRVGVLKHQVPHWLASVPLSHVVLQVAEAHLRHGGNGAYYVYLKRRR